MSLFNRIQTLAKAKGQQAIKDYTARTLNDSALSCVDGIAICDMGLAQNTSEAFLRLTEEALRLVKSLDPRRYRRICRHLAYIVNMPLISGGSFDRRLNICHVDFEKFFTSSDHEWNLRWYACLIVHEATHGVLEEKLILYTKDKRERIERLCHCEEYRFARRLDPGWANAYLRDTFDPSWWKLSWNGTRQERLAAYWKRFTEKRPPS